MNVVNHPGRVNIEIILQSVLWTYFVFECDVSHPIPDASSGRLVVRRQKRLLTRFGVNELPELLRDLLDRRRVGPRQGVAQASSTVQRRVLPFYIYGLLDTSFKSP